MQTPNQALQQRRGTIGFWDFMAHRCPAAAELGRSAAEGARVDEVVCPEHGRQGIGLACTHVAHAIDSGEPVGFFWGDDADTARPDAWCAACERALLAVPAGQSTEAWFVACDYKVLCAACWDVAKHRLYESLR